MIAAEKIDVRMHSREVPVDRVELFGLPLACSDGPALVGMVRNYLENGKRGWICGINAHAVNLATENAWLADFYRRSLSNCNEGFGVTAASFVLGNRIPPRGIWAYWIYDLLPMLQERGHSLYLLGGAPGVAEQAAQRLRTMYPSIRIVGCHHGFFDMADGEAIIGEINARRPDIVLVALGMPKQEEWIDRNFNKTNARLAFPVGALLDYVAGVKKRCPHWMTVVGMEWFYRLLTEPGRLWRRYTIGNLLFVWHIVRARLSRRGRTAAHR